MAMLTENFDLTGKKLSGEPLFFPVRRQKEFERLSDAYRMVFADLSCFPVRKAAGGDIRDVVYETAGWRNGPLTDPGPMRGAISWLGLRRRGSIRWCP